MIVVYSLCELRSCLRDVCILHEVRDCVNLSLDADEEERHRSGVFDAATHRWGDTNHITFCEAKDLVVELHFTLTTKAHVDLFVSLVRVEEWVGLSW